MDKPKLPVREGDVFAMPLTDGLAAVGVIARRKRTSMLSYLYRGDASWTSVNDIPDGHLDPAAPLYIGLSGWHNVRWGNWPVLGQLAGWNPTDWPIPKFANWHEGYGAFLIDELDNDLKDSGVRRAQPGEEEGLFPSGVAGLNSLQITMHAILTSPEGRWVPYWERET